MERARENASRSRPRDPDGAQAPGATQKRNQTATASSVRTAELADEREERQIHRNHNSANHPAKKDDHYGFESREQVFDCGVHLIFIEVRNFLQHGIHRARLLADSDHLRDHAGKDVGLAERIGQVASGFERLANVAERFLDDRVPRRAPRNVQTFENRDAGGDQSSQRAGEPGNSDLAKQDPNQGNPEQRGINGVSAAVSTVPNLQADARADNREENQESEDAADKIAEPDDDAGGQR